MIQIKSTISYRGRQLGSLLGGKGSPAKVAQIIKREVTDVIEGNAEAIVRVAGNYAKDILRERTLSGLDSRRSPLKPYTSAYKKRKMRFGKYRDKTDLSFSGQMLGDIVFVPASKFGGWIMFKSPRSRFLGGIHHRGEGKQPKRPFFAWHRGSADDVRLKSVIRRLWRERTRAQAGRR